ncbi:SDR family oxidoreductase [Nitrospirillum viridazoti]|uniref:Short chain dehydrogenase n=1 Tax=Nitrospirillum viridazoti CBAmc TaxID=1441467 RepID=A0A248JX98_9PROT|nr:SDR family oxidoreductase [Nitrospirillum amazonense]ASG23343.1 short chain dehydrogenase [Nitrospirillum amazonense CBAmc]TWB39982.1 NADP-dependent 3-hydroxy acid dehydrogenase YdfG [Nitrospirillum amazonense]
MGITPKTGPQGGRIFITGGASGLGLALGKRYARAGWRVAVGDINPDAMAAAVAELSAIAPDAFAIPCDVRDDAALDAAAQALTQRWGGVDIVVNNAGVAQAGNIDDTPLDDWRWIIDINLMGVVRGCKAFTPMFKAQGHGYFVNTASMAGLLDMPTMSAYNATKAAVVSLSETLQHELAPSGIGVSVICPSFFKTNLASSLRTTDPRLRARVDKLLNRPGITAEDVAEYVFQGVAAGRCHLLPHKEGRRFWLMKRLMPRAWYVAMIDKRARSMATPSRIAAGQPQQPAAPSTGSRG